MVELLAIVSLTAFVRRALSIVLGTYLTAADTNAANLTILEAERARSAVIARGASVMAYGTVAAHVADSWNPALSIGATRSSTERAVARSGRLDGNDELPAVVTAPAIVGTEM